MSVTIHNFIRCSFCGIMADKAPDGTNLYAAKHLDGITISICDDCVDCCMAARAKIKAREMPKELQQP